MGDNDNKDDGGALDAFMSSLDGATDQVGSTGITRNDSIPSDGGTLEDFMADAGGGSSNFITLRISSMKAEEVQ